MNFCERLNKYIEEAGASSKELAEASGLSPAVISRYRKGSRIPASESKQLKALVKGIALLTLGEEGKTMREERIFDELSAYLYIGDKDYTQIGERLDEIVTLFRINVTEMSRTMSFDASYFSKIRTGKRHPGNPEEFIDILCSYVTKKYHTDDDKKAAALLMECEPDEIFGHEEYLDRLKKWFGTKTTKEPLKVKDFLHKLDEFNLKEYVELIHFDELKVPNIPFYKLRNKTYYGIENMKQGELDFFKATLLAKSMEPVFMCSDMPMDDMAEDKEFGKKWMFAIAMALKKGMHLNIIHNLDRPFNEMMLGLQSWIPLYMTGGISPYYLKGIQNAVYCHFNYVSGKVALAGECIKGYHHDGKYYLTTNHEEVDYYKTKCVHLLEKAQPLMDIYRGENQSAYKSFIDGNSRTSGSRRRMVCSLPIHTISHKLIQRMLNRNGVTHQEAKVICESIAEHRKAIETIIKDNTFTDEVRILSKREFEESPVYLFTAGIFLEKKITYTYEEYQEHLRCTMEFEICNDNYYLKETKNNGFKNIQIYMHEGEVAIVSKNSDPVIHFVIRHSKLRSAIERFTPIYKDEDIRD